jgi:hypothetical protein
MSDEISYWNEIPLVPGAKEGSEFGNSYSYRVDVPAQVTEQFYFAILDRDGWLLSVREDGPSAEDEITRLLVFVRENEVITILLIGKNSSSLLIERVIK